MRHALPRCFRIYYSLTSSSRALHASHKLPIRGISFILRHMPLAEDRITSRYSISGYNSGEVIVNQTTYRQSLILSPHTVHCPWPIASIEDLDKSSLQIVLDMNPEVVLLGTGDQQQFPEASITALFGQRGIGLEVMNNGALCRTFNILVAEDRDVVAAIILS